MQEDPKRPAFFQCVAPQGPTVLIVRSTHSSVEGPAFERVRVRGRSLPVLLRKIPEPLLERLVLPRLLVPQLVVDPAAADVFRDVLTPRPEAGQATTAQLGLLTVAAYRRSVLPFFLECMAKRQRALRLALLINVPRAAFTMPPEALRRLIYGEVRRGRPVRSDAVGP